MQPQSVWRVAKSAKVVHRARISNAVSCWIARADAVHYVMIKMKVTPTLAIGVGTSLTLHAIHIMMGPLPPHQHAKQAVVVVVESHPHHQQAVAGKAAAGEAVAGAGEAAAPAGAGGAGARAGEAASGEAAAGANSSKSLFDADCGEAIDNGPDRFLSDPVDGIN